MARITIQDLGQDEELDARALTRVRGGAALFQRAIVDPNDKSIVDPNDKGGSQGIVINWRPQGLLGG